MTFRLRAKRVAVKLFEALIDACKRPSVVFILAGLLITYTGKIWWHIETISKAGATHMGFLAFFAEDLLVLGLLAAGALVVESLFPRRAVKVATAAVGALVAFMCALNTAWLNETGYQLTASIIEIGLTRFEELEPIIKYEMGLEEVLILFGAIVTPAAIALLFHLKARKNRLAESNRLALVIPALLILMSLQGYLQQQNPDLLGWRMIAGNLFSSVARDLLKEDRFSPLPDRPPVVDDAALEKVAGHRPNVLLVMLESVSYRASSFTDAVDTTPFLEDFAKQGLTVSNMRVVVPHSTKSLCATLCGTTPGLQQSIVESSDDFPMDCIPKVFSRLGYDTAYMQASKGWFEDLPRLTDRLGYKEFIHYNNIEPEPPLLGYLGADDQVLETAALDWIDRRKGPFFLTLFTSATHHPYVLPDRMPPLPDDLDPRLRHLMAYMKLVSETDRIIGNIVKELDRRGLGDDTIVVLMGDHGESFGDHGQFQHDNIFTEEGLHIPFALRFPAGVEPGTVVEENRTALDIAPTILELAGIPYNPRAIDGVSLLRTVPADEPKRFSCFYNDACIGVVRGDRKVVLLPNVDSWLTFDLAEDPKEMSPVMEGEVEPDEIEAMEEWYRSNRYRPDELSWAARSYYDDTWRCGKGYGKCGARKRVEKK